jgi:O-6-methylguanine DNA methyltransferase
MITPFAKCVYTEVSKIPRGFVSTYGQIAAKCNRPNAARAVGNILHINPNAPTVPCHRVVSSRGRLAANFGGGGVELQCKRLKEEGIIINDNTVDLSTYMWQ